MRTETQKIARFGLLTALTLVLGLLDRAVPLTAILGGIAPGIKLGLANTVLLYAVYLMEWPSCVLLMLTKVILSGLIFGSLTAILYSLSGGVLSLAAMLLLRGRPERGALASALAAAAADAYLLTRYRRPQGEILWIMILVALAFLASLAVFMLTRKHIIRGVTGTSLAGAVAHNVGQVLMASLVLKTPALLIAYLPVLVGVGAVVGLLTGIITERVLKALHFQGIVSSKETSHDVQ